MLLQCVQTEASPARRVLLSRAVQDVIYGVTSVSQQNHNSQQAVSTASPASGGGTAVQQQQAASEAAMRELLVRAPAAACLTSARCLLQYYCTVHLAELQCMYMSWRFVHPFCNRL